MKPGLFFIWLLICPSIYAGEILSLTLYISTQGKDSNPGTAARPLASLIGARDRIRALRKNNQFDGPIKVMIGHGNYYLSSPLQLNGEDGGTEGSPVIYTAAQGAHPVFYGGLPIKGFKKFNAKLWRVFIPEAARGKWNFEQLYVNGKRAQRAQFPNAGFYQPKIVTETIYRKGNGPIADSAMQKIVLYPGQATLLKNLSAEDIKKSVVTLYHKWDNTRKRILRYNAAENAIYITGKGMVPWNKIDTQSLFTIENVSTALDTPGEWFLDRDGYLYYMARPGESLLNIQCFAPLSDQFILITGSRTDAVAYLRFENLTFKVAGYQMPAAGNEPMQAAALVEAAVMVDYASNISFINCEIAHTGGNAIWFRKACSYSKVQHCYLHDLGAGGVKIGEAQWSGGKEEVTRNIMVDNNILRSGGQVFPCAVGLAIFNASDNHVVHNEIADFKYSGISAGWNWGYGESVAKRNRIEYNHIHHLGWDVLSDMGGIYTLGKSEGTILRNNVVHHVYSNSYGGWGLYTDEGSSGIVIENNLVYECKNSAFHQNYGKGNVVRNNIFYNQIHAQLEASKIEPHIGFRFVRNIVSYSRGDLSGIQWDQVNFSADSNIYWDTRTRDINVGGKSFKDWQRSGKDRNSIIADPQFVNPAQLDFRILNKTAMHFIGFKPFDYSKAGVYGTVGWKKLAAFDKLRARDFNAMVIQAEKKRMGK